MTEKQKIEFPLKPWMKALLNAAIVAGITTISVMAAEGSFSIEVAYSAFLAGTMTCLVQIKALLDEDLKDEKGESYTPLMFIK